MLQVQSSTRILALAVIPSDVSRGLDLLDKKALEACFCCDHLCNGQQEQVKDSVQ
jgi:hypothetical protein